MRTGRLRHAAGAAHGQTEGGDGGAVEVDPLVDPGAVQEHEAPSLPRWPGR